MFIQNIYRSHFGSSHCAASRPAQPVAAGSRPAHPAMQAPPAPSERPAKFTRISEDAAFVMVPMDIQMPSHELVLLTGGHVSVDGGAAHGSWMQLTDGLLRISWHWANINERAKTREYLRVPGTTVWRAIVRDLAWAHCLAEKQVAAPT